MALVSAVLLFAFITLCVTTYTRLKSDTEGAAEAALHADNMQGGFRPEIGRPDFRPGGDMARNIPTFTVRVSEDGDIIFADYGRVSITDDTAESAVKAAMEQGRSKGKIGSLGLRFAAEYTPNGDISIAFADTSAESAGMTRLILNSLIIGVAGLVALFFISLFLARLAVKPIEKAWRNQQQFIADAAHELKTPLTVIMANTGILTAHPEKSISQHMQWLNNTADEAGRMKNLIENMLELAKGDFAEESLILSNVNLSDIVTNSLLAFEPIAFEKNVAFHSDVAPNTQISGDSERLRRLIAILFDNAIKYAGSPGSAYVRLNETASHAVLTVHNSGEPIPAEGLGSIFDRFYRADESRSAGSSESYGLGLSIARQIADEHGAKIHVASTREEGTVFTVQFKKR
jgi:signal transduction histidine kinase